MVNDSLAGLLKAIPILGVSITFLASCWISVILRLFTRTRIVKNLGADDGTIILALGIFTGFSIQLIRLSALELTVDLLAHPEVFELVANLLLSIFGLYIATTVMLKVSLAIFFLRVVNKKWQRWVIYTSVGIYCTFGTAWLFIALFQCGNPANYLAAQLSPHPACLDYKTVLGPLNYLHSALNAVTDWVFAIIPIFVVRSTQMTRQARISVIAILLLGVVGSVCSIVRIAYVDVLGVGFGVKLLQQAPTFAILSCVEVGLGITSISCATLRPLFQKYLNLSRSTQSSGRYGRQTGASVMRRTGDQRSRAMGTEIDIEHDQVELCHVEEREKKPGAITVTTLIAHDVEANTMPQGESRSSEKDFL